MLDRILTLDHRRKRLLAKAPPGPLQDYLATPFAPPSADCHSLHYLALDLETNGVDPRNSEILSFGWVEITEMSIALHSAKHRVVRAQQPLSGENVAIHRLTDDTVAAGEPLATVIPQVLACLTGKVLVVHHAELEFRCLHLACEHLYGVGFLAPVVDTQWLARRTLERRNQPYGVTDLRLFNLRKRYNLPRYGAHNALSDACATAELFTAQIAELGGHGKMALKELLRRF